MLVSISKKKKIILFLSLSLFGVMPYIHFRNKTTTTTLLLLFSFCLMDCLRVWGSVFILLLGQPNMKAKNKTKNNNLIPGLCL
jgi:hypothetical protein